MNEKELIVLLDEAHVFINKDKRNKEIKRAKGEEFNIFSILNVQSREVRLHSKIIAELLNIKGNHGMKDIFLKEFLKNKNIWEDDDFDIMNSKVFVEKDTGPIKKKGRDAEGGRIDILIETPKQLIVIENKIYASDQENQLMRYFKYCKSQNKSFRLLYLTLDGTKASNYSSSGLEENKEYYRISYKEDILKWLENSLKFANNFQIVKEVLNQYIKTIKQLTNQDMDTKIQHKIFELIDKPERIECLIELKNIWGFFQSYIVKKYLKPQIEKVAKRYDLEFEIDNAFLECQDISTGFHFWKPEWNFSLYIATYDRDWSYFYLGLKYKNSKPDNQIIGKLNCFTKDPTSNYPYGWSYLMDDETNYTKWNDNLLLDIVKKSESGELSTFMTNIEQQIKIIMDEITSFENIIL